jgi:hypothetical protein
MVCQIAGVLERMGKKGIACDGPSLGALGHIN